MNTFLKKYKTLFLLKAFITICFFTCSITSFAQVDTIHTGRLSDIDSNIYVQPPVDSIVVDNSDEEEEPVEDEEAQEVFFIKKNTFNGPDSFVVRTLPDSVASVMKNDKSFWYADKAFRKKEQEDHAGPFWQGPGFQSFMWIVIIIAFVGFLTLYLKEGSISIFRKTKTITENNDAESDGNIFEINYQKEIDKAIAAGDYRLAIRLMYLRLLKSLSEKGKIQYAQDKTNFDYLVETSSKKWYNLFFNITRHYEYAWYGQFEVDSDKFEIIRKEFMNFEKQV